ncbi:MAG: DUF3494 domain-containing protein [Deltaproteobacteria bacterium]|nr:DUF3494 domain-containing protein [Deltaproteobacteria bacterium]
MRSGSRLLNLRATVFLLVPLAIGCGSAGSEASTDGGSLADSANPTDSAKLSDGGAEPDGSSLTTPTVTSNTPTNGAVAVPVNGSISATFSESMDPSTLSTNTFTLVVGATAIPVPATVFYESSKAYLLPSAQLQSNATFKATVTTGARSALGAPLAENHVWSFTTSDSVAQQLPVKLGGAGAFVILAKSAISTVPTSAVTGNIGVSPAAATFITGFSLIADSTNVFSTSTQVTGKVFAADYAPPTPSNLTTAVGDMELALTEAAGRAPTVIELGAGNIGGMTLAPGVYKWSSGVLIPTDVTLSGSASDIWIFQIAQGLTVESAATILLSGGALARNVFWQVSGSVDLGTTAHLEGIVLCQTAIALHTGASVHGRMLAQTGVTIDGSAVVEPAP